MGRNGLFVSSGLTHRGPARRLVHRLKYDGDQRAALVLATAMLRSAPPDVSGWVAVPRARSRVWRYGVDPAAELCSALASLTGIPVSGALRSGFWWSSHHRGSLAGLSAPRFCPTVAHVHRGWVLVDDVATTMATLEAARDALGRVVTRALVATAPARAVINLRATTDTTL